MAISHFKSDYSDVVIQSIRDCPQVIKDIVCDSSFRQHNRSHGVCFWLFPDQTCEAGTDNLLLHLIMFCSSLCSNDIKCKAWGNVLLGLMKLTKCFKNSWLKTYLQLRNSDTIKDKAQQQTHCICSGWYIHAIGFKSLTVIETGKCQSLESSNTTTEFMKKTQSLIKHQKEGWSSGLKGQELKGQSLILPATFVVSLPKSYELSAI